MTRTFNHNGRTFGIRSAPIDDALKIGVFDGDRRLYTLDIPFEVLSDMRHQPIAGSANQKEFEAFVEADFRRLLDVGLLTV